METIKLKIARHSIHPWIFTKMVEHPRRRPHPGTLVKLIDRDKNYVGQGIYHPDNQIAIRVLTTRTAAIDIDFFRERIESARILREDILQLPQRFDSDCYRLLHAEGDRVSGIIADKYADWIVLQPHTAGALTFGDWIVAALKIVYPGINVAWRIDTRAEKKEGVSFQPLVAKYPCPATISVRENGLDFCVNLNTGHKTGFFLDQKENRQTVANLATDKTVLDLCCYTGGFALNALKNDAKNVTAVDLDEEALVTAKQNARLNKLPTPKQKLDFVHANVFDFLRNWEKTGQQADLVIADPAKLAGVKDEIPRALKTYNDLNRLAIKAVKTGGMLATYSCSGLVSDETFRSVISRAALEAGRSLQFVAQTGACGDHPILAEFPEGRYLKAIYARVE